MRHTSLDDDPLMPVIGDMRDSYSTGATADGSVVPLRARFPENMAEYCAVIARQHNVSDLALAVCRSVEDAIPAAHARLMICDGKAQTIYSAIESLTREPVSIDAGLSGYVARTGESVNVRCAAEDPRYHRETDDPGGSGDGFFLASPILSVDATVLGVVIAVRSCTDPPFSSEDSRALQCLAFSAAPTLGILLDMLEQLPASDAKLALRGSDLFLAEALEHHLKSVGQDGSLLRSMPGWLRHSHLAIVGLSLCGLAFLTLWRAHDTVSGPALVRGQGLLHVTAPSPGVVESVLVKTGERVRAGQALMRLRWGVGASRVHYAVQAREDGVIDEVRIQPGQQVRASDELVRLRVDGAAEEVLCFLPASRAADLRPGMKLTLHLRGYEGLRETLSIVETEDIHNASDPAFDREKVTATALGVTLPVVLVRSYIPKKAFDASGKTDSDQNGLVGEGAVVIRSKPLIISLVPGLSNVLEHWKDFFKTE